MWSITICLSDPLGFCWSNKAITAIEAPDGKMVLFDNIYFIVWDEFSGSCTESGLSLRDASGFGLREVASAFLHTTVGWYISVSLNCHSRLGTHQFQPLGHPWHAMKLFLELPKIMARSGFWVARRICLSHNRWALTLHSVLGGDLAATLGNFDVGRGKFILMWLPSDSGRCLSPSFPLYLYMDLSNSPYADDK